VLERLGNYTLMQFELETGRTHQIRVHAAHLRLPIVGDPLYTQSKTSPVKLSGQALHAWKLSFVHPRTGQPLQVTAPLPEEFERLLRQLRSQAG
jgi:23S rRNA pseudouridine1911/1915/1917 synthase